MADTRQAFVEEALDAFEGPLLGYAYGFVHDLDRARDIVQDTFIRLYQQDRAKAYRIYVEDAAANPNCVGTHWFTVYDQSAIGRADGENYQIGFLDVCNRPYDEMGAAAIASHERLYEVAAGKAQPFSEQLEYLPMLY